MLLVRFGNLGLGEAIGRHDRFGQGLNRGHMGHSVRGQNLILGVGCDKSQMSLIVVVVGV